MDLHTVPIPVTMALANIPKHRELKMTKKNMLNIPLHV